MRSDGAEIPIAPSILSVAPFTRMGFYDFFAAKHCPLSGCNTNIAKSALDIEVVTRPVFLGLFYHDVMECAEKSQGIDDLRPKIDCLLVAYQKKLIALPELNGSGALNRWEEVNAIMLRAMQRVSSRSSSRSQARMFAETLLVAKNGIFVGKPDMFSILDRRAFLSEYKSGSLREPNNAIKNIYLEQINFYAFLIYQNYDVEIVHATLESAFGDKWEVTFTQEDANSFYEKCLRDLDIINSRLNSARLPDLASATSPSLDNCRYCKHKISCLVFYRAQSQWIEPNQELIATGNVVSIDRSNVHADFVSINEVLSGAEMKIQIPKGTYQEIQRNRPYIFSWIKKSALGYQLASNGVVYAKSN